MLQSLHIRNYILIDSLDIRFPEGLVIITGQTGAGKSILLGALSLLSGTKAEASMISEGADSCVVEAEFSAIDDTLREMLSEADVDADDDSLTIRRVVNSSGRSRCFVNDCPVQVGLLQDISEHLIDIHSQHKSLLLTDHRFQLSVLDHFAGNRAKLAECRGVWKQMLGMRRELDALREKLRRLDADRDYNAAQFRQLEEAGLKEGELEALEEEQKGLANAEQIKEALSTSLGLLSPGDDAPGVVAALRDASRQLERISRYVPSAEQLASRMDSARIELDDILSEIEALDGRIDISPERLEAVEDRMSQLYSLMKKHACSSVGELIAVRERFGEALFDSSSLEERIASMEKELSAVEQRYAEISAELSASRKAVVDAFGKTITDDLHFLELDRAEFCVDIQQAQDGPDGRDKVSYLFSSNGLRPTDIAKCASGGELSRIMLCLKAMMARFMGMPTLIFDEIDTGVSGSVADKMGQMVCRMGENMQVFSITHLPQVAAKGNAHYVVEKAADASGKTISAIHKVEGLDRVMEVARLLSGSTITPAAVANAESLLAEGR